MSCQARIKLIIVVGVNFDCLLCLPFKPLIRYDRTNLVVFHSECKQSIAQLQASVSVLLHSLERVDPDPELVGGYFSWNVDEGVKCACFLRRIYEEVYISVNISLKLFIA